MSGPDLEIEDRLRRLGPAYKDGIEPPATLHVSVMAHTIPPRRPARRPSMLRELSLAAALIAFVALLAFGFSRLHSVVPGPIKRSPSPSPVSRVVPWVSTTLKSQAPKTLTVDQAAQDVRKTVTDVTPVLLPSAIPSGFQVQLYDDNGGFSASYVAADGRKIMFSIVVPNPAPGTANARQSQPMFRGVRAEYHVDDGTVPTSHRWLMWNEPGTAAGGQPGVPYFLTTDGFTETEFWTIANSIGPIPAPVVPPTCRLADLYVASSGSNGATGHVLYGIAITNHGTTACSLTGSPGISLVTPQGTVLSLPQQPELGGMVGTAKSHALLPPNQAAPVPYQASVGASFMFEWYYCGGTVPQVAAVDIALPGTVGVRRVPLLPQAPQIPSRCDDPSLGRVVLVGPIQGPTADSIAVMPAAPRVTLAGVPDNLVAGQTLRYEVTITNDSAAVILFDTCPAYDEGFTPDAMVTYVLNCEPVGRLDTGASATFAMELTVRPSPKAPLGPQKFLWRLHWSYGGASAGKVVTVSAS